MNDLRSRPVSMTIAAVKDFLPAVTQYVETAALFFGLGRNESLNLRLAAEEIFSYLCDRVCRGKPVEVVCSGGLFFARVEFHFSVSTLDMGALNLTTSVSLAGEEDMAQMGLVIASRTVDRLFISTSAQEAVALAIEQDKAYPAAAGGDFRTVNAKGALIVEIPDAESLRRLAVQAGSCPSDPLRPAFFSYPGKLADMITSGHCHALVAKDASGTIAGGLLYRSLTEKIVEVFSPCLFDPSRADEVAGLLLEACIAKTVRTKAVGLVGLTGLPVSLRGQFETLGEMTYEVDDAKPIKNPAYCRLLSEDPGCQVWTHPFLRAYLEEEYSRLFLARDIRDVSDMGETLAGPSIFSTEIRREKSEARLRPLWPGGDLADNLARHVALCKSESLKNVFFVVDLGVSWHARLAPVLMNSSFKPRMIIPFAGQADLVIFQYDEPES